ncbi:MAG: FAD-dependent oxidoreductase [Eubacteriales bacterium]|nr:FAD-dependent oxidoreductase [Eubacteriales bacterium]
MKRLVALFLCVSMVFGLTAYAAAPYADGVHVGQGTGMGGMVTVSVTVENGNITGIVVDKHAETPGLSDPAFDQIPAAIIKANSPEVDVVAGATITSKAIKEAVANALSGTGEAASEDIEIALEPDVIVVGAGLAGLVSAVKAAELGANVLILEQNVRVGGSALFAGGSISGAGFKIQSEMGVEDTPEQFYADFVRLSGGEDFNTEIARIHTERSGPAIDWLQDEVGVDFGDEYRLDTGSYYPMYPDRVTYALAMSPAGGAQGFLQALTPRLDSYIAEGKAQLMLNTEVTDVIIEDGDIVGVMIGDKAVYAPSTIIATGGYGYSEEWLLEYNFDQVTSANPPTATGSGYNFARKAGAVFDKMQFCYAYPGSIPVTGFQATVTANTRIPGVVLVDQNGNRTYDETSSGASDAYKAAENNVLYVLVAENMITEQTPLFRPAVGAPAIDSPAKLKELLDEGKYVFKADTIEELAQKIGTAGLPETIAQYNLDCAAGTDSLFGRTANLNPLEEGPFYAVYTIPYVLMTSGGPRINGQAQLVREDSSVVGGAYLAGEIIGSANVGGNTTIGGIGHGLCVTWGIIAAENAVANAGK